MIKPLDFPFEAIIGEALTPLLNSTGLREHRSVFTRKYGSMLHIVGVQRSMWNDRTEIRFTLNGGVYVPQVVSLYLGRPDPKSPIVTDC